jgi:ADP-heptose:LPS heptosyltransferase
MRKNLLLLLKRNDYLLFLCLLAPAAILKFLLRQFGAPVTDRPLIVRPGGLGDLVLLTLAFEQLGLSPKDCDWVVETRSMGWAEHLGLNYVCYDQIASRKTLGMLWSRHSLVINTEQRFALSGLIAYWTTGPKGRLFGFDSNRAVALYNHAQPYDPRATHELAEFKNLLRSSFPLSIAESIKEVSISRQSIAFGYVAIGLVGADIESKNLSAEIYFWLAQKYNDCEKIKIVCARGDLQKAEELRVLLKSQGLQVEISDGSFAQAIDWIRLAKLLLTADGGLTHVASYFGVPSIVAFTSAFDAKWRPLAKGSKTLMRMDLSCRPCALFAQVPPCPHQFACKDHSRWVETTVGLS